MKKVENKYLLDQYIEYSVSDVILINKSTGMESFIASLESDKLSKSCDEEMIKGGSNNLTFATITKNQEIVYELTDVLSREDINLGKWGAKMKNGTVLAYHRPHNYTVTESTGKKVTLDETPHDVNEVAIYNTKTNTLLNSSSDYSISGKEVTITAEGVNAGDTVWVTSYRYEKTTVDYYDVGDSSVPSVYEVILMKPIYDTNDQIVFYRQTHIPKAKMSNNIESNGNTEKTKQTQTSTLTVMKDPAYDYVMRVMLIPAK